MAFDICVIGGGAGGYAAASRAWSLGKKVCLVNSGPLGGAGVVGGVVESKTYWERSRDYTKATRSDRGYIIEGAKLHYNLVVASVRTAISEVLSQLEEQLDRLSKPLPGQQGRVEYIPGRARFIDANTVEVQRDKDGVRQQVRADYFIIATGSRPRVLGDMPVDGERIITSDHILDLPDFPRSLLILGSGVVGCEYATIFGNFGQTKVHLIDRRERILPFEDPDVSRFCTDHFIAQGVRVHHSVERVQMEVDRPGDKVHCRVCYGDGSVEVVDVERVLVSIGRVPNTAGLDLENAGINVDERGYIPVQEGENQSCVPHIYAIGDVSWDMALANVAKEEGINAVERICKRTEARVSYRNLSTIMFLRPEVAAVGMNEQQAQADQVPYRMALYDMALVNRTVAMGATDGFVKLLVDDRSGDKMEVIGARAVGEHASSIIDAIALMIQERLPIKALADMMHPEPAVTVALQECARMLMGSSVLRPEVFHRYLRLARVRYGSEGKVIAEDGYCWGEAPGLGQ